MKNKVTFCFGLIGFVVMTALMLSAGLAPSLSPVFISWVSVVGLLMAGELVLLGIGKKQQ